MLPAREIVATRDPRLAYVHLPLLRAAEERVNSRSGDHTSTADILEALSETMLCYTVLIAVVAAG